MTTQWDDDRIRATVRPRNSKCPVSGMDEVGYTVQLHDAGPPGERLNKPVLLFDSESAHGTAGVFADDDVALAFSTRRHAAELRCQREVEAERHRRKDALSERQRDLWAEEKRQQDIAKDARAAAKAADLEARTLAEEAEHPEISISCNPSDDGWSLWAAGCVTDGTKDGDPRQLVIEGSGMLGPRKLVDSDEHPKRAGLDPLAASKAYDDAAAESDPPKIKRWRKGDPVPKQVPDVNGEMIGIGSRVQFSTGDDDPLVVGDVTKIGDYLRNEASWTLEVEDAQGQPWDAMAHECTRVAGDEQAEDWPDPEAG